jgi:hypothetical protein
LFAREVKKKNAFGFFDEKQFMRPGDEKRNLEICFTLLAQFFVFQSVHLAVMIMASAS